MNVPVATMPLGKVAERNERANPQDYPDMPYIGLDDVEAHTMRLIGWKSAGSLKSSAKKFYKRDVLYSRLRPYLNKIWVADRDGLCSSEFIIFPKQQDIDPKFLAYRISARDFVAFANSLNSGDRPRVNFKQISSFGIPAFDVNEQQLIVEKIETLFSELDKGIESLKTARKQLKAYRQAVLKHAFEGKLTEQWRQQNPDKLESPEQLLARIQQEREQRYKQQLVDWGRAVKAWEENGKEGKKPRKPRVPIKSQGVDSDEKKQLPALPSGWTWVRPEEISAAEEHAIGIGPFGSNLKVSDYRNAGVPLIFVRNITRKDFVSDLRYIGNKKFLELYAHSLKPLDLVITKMGDPPGDCEIYPEHSPVAVLTADCLKFRLFEGAADRRFYMYCIKSNFVKRQLGLITKGVAQKKISVERFKTVSIPMPSYKEQVEIADQIEKIFSLIEDQEKSISSSLEIAETLRQSILKKAFSGQLAFSESIDAQKEAS